MKNRLLHRPCWRFHKPHHQPIGLIFVSLIILIFISPLKTVGQDTGPGLIKVIPLSPNAAALGEFGNIPVSYYTGLPSIALPVYQVSSGKLNLPVSLSYHASGVKVEELASWVGLGWNLSTGGIISRSVRGIPDEDANGYFNQSLSVNGIITHAADPSYATEIQTDLIGAGKEQYDTEADIFSFDLGNEQGKFIYNQEDQQFYTIPRQNIKIAFDPDTNGGFILTSSSGDVYRFTVKEAIATQAICTPATTASTKTSVTSWYLDNIVSYDKKDTISFTYEDHTLINSSLGNETTYFLESVSGASLSPAPDPQHTVCSQSTTMYNKQLKEIHFKGGMLKFNAATSSRCDLIDDEALDNIQLFDHTNTQLKKWKFTYGYFGSSSDTPSGCTDYDQSYLLRLKLKSFQESSLLDTAGVALNPYLFEYDDTALPSRFSYAQDFWGYYNGKNSNTSLIPSYIASTSNGPVYISGAERLADPVYAIAGSLKKVTYPTLGSTTYTFESNWVNDTTIVAPPISNQVALYGDGTGTKTMYDTTFTINYGANDYNGHNPAGGAFVSFNFGEVGCDISSGASTCAILALEGVSSGAPGFTINTPINYHYLPNGTYKLTASFNQSPPLFSDFYFTATWLSPDPGIIANKRFTGGLRVKKIVDHDGLSTDRDMVRTFRYTLEADSTLSTGTLNGYPQASNYLQHGFLYIWHSFIISPAASATLYRYYCKATSYSNIPLIQTSGNYTSYDKVMVSSGENGKTTYRFTQIQDILSHQIPYVTFSNEWRRGLLLEQKEYKYTGGIYMPVKQVADDYNAAVSKLSYGIKIYFPQMDVYQTGDTPDVTPGYDEYTDEAQWLDITRVATKEYDGSDSTIGITAVKDMDYNLSSFMLATERTLKSNGDSLITAYTYAQDYGTLSSTDNLSQGIKYLQDNHIYNKPVEIISRVKTGSVLKTLSGVLNSYKPGNAVIDTIWRATFDSPTTTFVPAYTSSGRVIKSSAYQPEIMITQYDAYNNVAEQRRKGASPVSYIWGYNGRHLIAEIRNADYSSVISALGGASAVASFEANPNPADTTVNSFLAPLRTSLTNALVTTYTYATFPGITSSTDPKGTTIYYQYDSFQRLKAVKDKYGNMVKVIDYHYKN